MMGISYSQLMIVLIVAVVLFGSRLPEVLRPVGRAYAQFRKGLADLQYSMEDESPSGHVPRISNPTPRERISSSIPTTDPGEEDFGRSSTPKFSPPPANDVS